MKYFKFKNPKTDDFILFQVENDNNFTALAEIEQSGEHGISKLDFKVPFKEIYKGLIDDGCSVKEVNLDDYIINLEYLKYKACALNSGFIKED